MIYILLKVVLSILLGSIIYKIGYNNGYTACIHYFICEQCKGLDSCQNPDSEHCKWEL